MRSEADIRSMIKQLLALRNASITHCTKRRYDAKIDALLWVLRELLESKHTTGSIEDA